MKKGESNAVLRELPIDYERAGKQICNDEIPLSATTVLLGESTHGTEEFYQLRASMSAISICWPSRPMLQSDISRFSKEG